MKFRCNQNTFETKTLWNLNFENLGKITVIVVLNNRWIQICYVLYTAYIIKEKTKTFINKSDKTIVYVKN